MKKPDRRTERTRTALMGAFVAIILADGYDAVTVEAVTARADVGRSTFYMHFTGKEDILRHALTRPSSVLAALVGGELPPGALTAQLAHFHEQRRRNRAFFAGTARSLWVRCLAGLIEPRLALLTRRARPLLPLPLAALQIAESQIALIAGWLGTRPAASVEAVAEALAATTRANVAALLGLRQDAPPIIPGERLAVRQR